MRRGPPPTPTAMLISWRKKKRSHEPQPPKTRPTCPGSLSPAGKKKFRETVKHLESMDVLTKVDGDAVALYSDLSVWLKDCREFLAKHGDAYPTYDADGNPTGYRPYPQVSLALKLAAQVARLEGELGLTPSGRTRLQVSDKAPAQLPSRSRSILPMRKAN